MVLMSDAHHRKKQPALVRQQLLEVAARLASEQGMAAVTLDAVSGASGVSKGGLLHHFPNKNALLEGLLDSLLVTALAAGVPDEPNSMAEIVPRLLNGAAQFGRGERI